MLFRLRIKFFSFVSSLILFTWHARSGYSLQSAATSDVVATGERVVKTVRNYMEYDVISREVCTLMLKLLKKFNWRPQLLDFDSKYRSLTKSFAGAPLSRDNIPQDLFSFPPAPVVVLSFSCGCGAET